MWIPDDGVPGVVARLIGPTNQPFPHPAALAARPVAVVQLELVAFVQEGLESGQRLASRCPLVLPGAQVVCGLCLAATSRTRVVLPEVAKYVEIDPIDLV